MDSFDLLVVGGGINGAAIARDAAGRGLKVLLVERDDLAGHTSSASSKLIHGGLRYLERYEFRLVRESLHEREVLLRTAPHIVRPLRFILPDPKGGRPWWMIRTGLFLYGLLAGRGSLKRPRAVKRADATVRGPLTGKYRLAEYWDAWVDDARLVVLNALDAAERGAEIATQTELLAARREGERWVAELGGGRRVSASMIVNAAGPWVAEVLGKRLGRETGAGVRLVKGSHIAVPRLHDGDHAYILQSADGRVVFVLPYGELSLIGTTDTPVERPEDAVADAAEIEYLCAAANSYFARQTAPEDVRWRYAGIRALYDDGAGAAKDVTRDYRLELDQAEGAKLLSVFGGKITTARALATEALDKLGVGGFKFTRTTALPGGDLGDAFSRRLAELGEWMPAPMLTRMAQAYGTRIERVIGDAASLAELGRHLGGDLYETEVRYLTEVEFARTADDIMWRRTKLGLQLSNTEQRELGEYIAARSGTAPEQRGCGVMQPPRTIGWKVDENQRVELLQQFTPVYPRIDADHVTFETKSTRPLPEPKIGEIVGIADDGEGVQALVVSIDGSTDRPDGSTWHITWSLREGREAVESNEVIAEKGWARFDMPVPVTLHSGEW